MQKEESDAEEGVHAAHYAASWRTEREREKNIRTVLYETHFV